MTTFKVTSTQIIFLLLFFGCASSTGSRYEKEKDEELVNKEEKIDKEVEPVGKFDMTPYHSTFDFNIKDPDSPDEIWYGYDSSSLPGREKIITHEAGYRVEVLATDDLEEANNMRSELNFRLKQNIYIIFDPPFYRIRTGDYLDRNSAESQSFKLKQLGYIESRVVSDSVQVTGFR